MVRIEMLHSSHQRMAEHTLVQAIQKINTQVNLDPKTRHQAFQQAQNIVESLKSVNFRHQTAHSPHFACANSY